MRSQQKRFDDFASGFLAIKTYDGTATAGALTIGSLVGVEAGDTNDVSVTGSASDLSNDGDAGTQTSTVTYTISGNASSNYNAPNEELGVQCVVNKKDLTISQAASIAAKTYDGTATAGALTIGSLVGVEAGDTNDVSVTGSASDLSNDGDAGTQTSTVTYTISGNASSNYNAPNEELGVQCVVNKKRFDDFASGFHRGQNIR